jgi:hypothetical protein
MWVEVILALVIVALVIWIIFFGGGTLRTQKLTSELRSARNEATRLREVNEALRASLETAHAERTRLFSGLCTIAGELEQMKAALGGSRTAREQLKQKYKGEPGPELLERILASVPKVSPPVKKRLAHEILVAETGRTLLNDMSSGVSITKAAANAGVPVIVARNKVRALQTLGYLDDRLRLTELGRGALI